MSIAVDSIQTYTKLVDVAHNCRLCPKMEFRRTFLNEHNGPLSARVMFIGEATNVGLETQLAKPMWDSPSGDNLNALLRSVGLSRDEVFVTNTVLHTPVQDPREYPARMRYVTEEEQKNCSSFLLKQIELVNPEIICTLGNKALAGLALSVEHHLMLKHDVGRVFPIAGNRWLIPLYHPSPQVMAVWRKWDEQVEDYKVVRQTLTRLENPSDVINY